MGLGKAKERRMIPLWVGWRFRTKTVGNCWVYILSKHTTETSGLWLQAPITELDLMNDKGPFIASASELGTVAHATSCLHVDHKK
jgi:hypothetical protein